MSAFGSGDIVELWPDSRTSNRVLIPLVEDNIAQYSSGIYDLFPSSRAEIMRLGYPSHENILEKCGYVLSFNFDRKVPNWVCECLTADQIEHMCQEYPFRRSYKKFFEDPDLDPGKGATLNDYKMSGYVRGHLAAAANHIYNINAFKSTYCLSNVVPMHNNVNTIIEKFEHRARKIALNKGKVYICTGPVFKESEPSFLKLESDVQIPSSIFKTMVYMKDGKSVLQSFEVENSPDLPSNQCISTYVKTYKKQLSTINFETGLNILSEVNVKDIKDVLFGRWPLPNPVLRNLRRQIGWG